MTKLPGESLTALFGPIQILASGCTQQLPNRSIWPVYTRCRPIWTNVACTSTIGFRIVRSTCSARIWLEALVVPSVSIGGPVISMLWSNQS
jgi:hypothetical protein